MSALVTPERQQHIEWQLTRLSIAFFHHLDRREYEALDSLLAPDGVMHFGATVTHGLSELCALARKWPNLTTRHIVTNLYFTEVTEHTAVGHGLLTVFVGPPREGSKPVAREPGEPHVTEMHDRYICLAGRWCIAERTFSHVLLPAKAR